MPTYVDLGTDYVYQSQVDPEFIHRTISARLVSQLLSGIPTGATDDVLLDRLRSVNPESIAQPTALETTNSFRRLRSLVDDGSVSPDTSISYRKIRNLSVALRKDHKDGLSFLIEQRKKCSFEPPASFYPAGELQLTSSGMNHYLHTREEQLYFPFAKGRPARLENVLISSPIFGLDRKAWLCLIPLARISEINSLDDSIPPPEMMMCHDGKLHPAQYDMATTQFVPNTEISYFPEQFNLRSIPSVMVGYRKHGSVDLTLPEWSTSGHNSRIKSGFTLDGLDITDSLSKCPDGQEEEALTKMSLVKAFQFGYCKSHTTYLVGKVHGNPAIAQFPFVEIGPSAGEATSPFITTLPRPKSQ